MLQCFLVFSTQWVAQNLTRVDDGTFIRLTIFLFSSFGKQPLLGTNFYIINTISYAYVGRWAFVWRTQ